MHFVPFFATLLYFGLRIKNGEARNILRNAPQICPIEHGNLIDVKLFVQSNEECFKHCEVEDRCRFYRFFSPMADRPKQCFLFRTCGRNVERAEPDCVINKENTIEVKPFVRSQGECQKLCQMDRRCGYYKYFPRVSPPTAALAPTGGNDAPINNALSDVTSLLATPRLDPISADNQEEFCYTLNSCSKRMVANVECTLGKNNFLSVKYFVESNEVCKEICQGTYGCRYFYWYPMEHSEAPKYCYLFRQCAAQDAEPEVALVIGGRHPGHYFMTKKQHNDLVMRSDVCKVNTRENVSLARAGATSEYVNDKVLFCGGKNGYGVHKDCLVYDPMTEVWAQHSNLSRPREEAASATIGTTTYVIGGVGHRTVEVLTKNATRWSAGAALPVVMARACAVAVDDSAIYIMGGHDNASTNSLPVSYRYRVTDGKWTSIPDMKVPRRDHACLFLELENTRGILVTGGLGDNDEVLDSAEFYDLKSRKWTLTSSMKVGRTEHGMSLIYGIPTVIGGLSDNEFLSNMEQFDKSSASWNVPLARDWRIISNVLNAPRYEMTVASIPISKVRTCDADFV